MSKTTPLTASTRVRQQDRMVNLAMYLDAAPQPVSAEDICTNVPGYDSGAYSPGAEPKLLDAFKRMFEHDKDALRAAGFTIVTTTPSNSDVERYRLDLAASFAARVELSPTEAAVVRVAGLVALSDPQFPAPEELRLALAKIAGALGGPTPVRAQAVDSSTPVESAVAVVQSAVSAQKTLSFDYVDAREATSSRAVHPYGTFRNAGSWYLVAFDPEKADIRVFNIERMSGVEQNARKPKTPDFESPEDFRVSDYVGLPFQYGSASFRARLRFSADVAWQAVRLTKEQGSLERNVDGSCLWTVEAKNEDKLLGWVIANGPGIEIVDPPALIEVLKRKLAAVEDIHG